VLPIAPNAKTGTDACASHAHKTLPTELPDSVTRRVIQRVQLFFPPMVFNPLQSRQTALFPLGIGYIAQVLEDAGYDVSLVDCPTEGYDTTIKIGKDRVVYGLTPEQIKQRIIDYKPDMVGISCLFSSLENRAMQVARCVREVDPTIPIVIGGPHASGYYERLLMRAEIDYAVMGEGEQTLLDLIAAMKEERLPFDNDGLTFRQNRQIHVLPRKNWIENLDTVPFPARHMVDMDKYWNIGKTQGLRLDGDERLKIAQMTTSRGCPFQCTYCAKHVTWGSGFRERSAKNIVDEIEHLVENYGVQRVAFQDDNLTANMDRAFEIFQGIVDRKIKITWEAHNGLGVNYLSPELLDVMKASGCVSFTIAVESANPEILIKVKKPNYIKLAPPIVDYAKSIGIEVRGFFMIGFPNETMEQVRKTIEYARKLKLAVAAFAVVTPLPGTVLFKQVVEQGLINEGEVDFEDLSFGQFDLQLSKVPVETLKAIRKMEWLRTVLLDDHGNLKSSVQMHPNDAREELEHAMVLLPNEPEIDRIYSMAAERWQWDDQRRCAS
jgi:anaerobic magnesium-protoporphyrin IX monomethyl ester cyclase